MTDTSELTAVEPSPPQELAEMITELEHYRERLINDTLKMAQRAKVMKAQAMAALEPSLAEIDANLEALRQRQATLSAENESVAEV